MNRPQLSDDVATHVRELVLTGHLRGGQYVRVDRIAVELGISITPVREGLLLLRGEGLLTLEPRRGFVVSPLSPGDLHDLFWVQAQIAGELAARAATALTDDQVASLGGLQDELTTALEAGDLDAVEQLNHAFHRTINLAAEAPKLQWFLRTATRYVPLRSYHRISGWPETSHDHVAVVAAILARDPGAARDAMIEHVLHSGRLLAEHADLPG